MDNLLGAITFTKEETAAMNEAKRGWNVIFGAHGQAWQSVRQDDLHFVADLLTDAMNYIVLNIGKPDPENKFLPSVKSKDFLLNTGTMGRIHAAMLDVNAAWLSLNFNTRRANAAAHLDVSEVLTSLYRHVEYAVNERNKPGGRQY